MLCSFCGKHKDDIMVMIVGPDVYICNECVALCVEIVEEHQENVNRDEIRETAFNEIWGTD